MIKDIINILFTCDNNYLRPTTSIKFILLLSSL